MKLCFVTEEFPPETDWGGIATCFYNQALAMDKLGHLVRVFSYTTAVSRIDLIPGTQIQVHRVQIRPIGGRLRGMFYKIVPEFWRTIEWNYMVFRYLVNFSKSVKVDLIQVPEYHFLGIFFSLFTRIPVTVYLNGNRLITFSGNRDKHKLDLFLINIFERWSVRLAVKRLIANSKLTADKVREWIPGIKKKIYVSYPFLTDIKIHERVNLPFKDYIFFAGRLEKRKGPDLLLRAFVKIAEKKPNISLVLAGRDTNTFLYENRLLSFKELMKMMKLKPTISKRIHLIGHIKGEELKNYYKNSLFCVFPSDYEPFGMVIIEAMSQGKAVITSRNGGASEFMVNYKNGILVKPESEQITEACEKLLNQPKLRNRIEKEAVGLIKSKFEPKKSALKLEKIYKEFIS